MRKGLIIAAAIAVAAGCAFGGVILWIAFQHNSQGEYIDDVTGQIDWANSMELFVAATLPAAAAVFAVLALGYWVVRMVRPGGKA